MADKVHNFPGSPRPRQRAIWRGEVVFSILFIWYSRNTGHSFWVYWAPFFLGGGALLLGIPFYLGQRRHMSQPAPVPPYREVERGG